MALAFSFVLFFIRLSVRRQFNKKTAAASLSIITLVVLLLFLGVQALPNKFTKLVSYLNQPFQLFDKPLIFERIDPPTLSGLIFLNSLTIAAFIIAYKKRKQMDTGEVELVVAAAATNLLLASPFIGQALANRFNLLALGPSIILYAFIFNNSKYGAKFLAAAMILIVLIFTPPTLAQIAEPSIPENSVAELAGLKSEIQDPRHSLIITKHGLEWWAAWFLRTDVSQEFSLTAETWKEYQQVFFLNELGDRKSPFPEIRLPADAKIIHQGKYFQLYTAQKVPDFYPLPKPQ